ncbi:MAG TPA: LysR family transcriptional regulator [Gaiellaceae bacterium]|jgi:DNA-binding transcriptional LysR family regulator|nr:LysR family transcriptional regulator [Gaiellaceae bacterium]
MRSNQWLGVELRHLAALDAVARTRSFGRAARELGYTQSAVSQQIAQLEQIVGQRLFDRPGGPRRVEPTEAGELLLGHADAIVARLDAARADMAALAEGAVGTLRVGIYQSVGAHLLPALVRRFRAQWPRVDVRVREESDAAELFRLLEHGELDLTFADLPVREGPFEWTELLQDPYVLLVSARSDLASRDAAPPLRELAKLPLIGRRSTDEPERHLAGRVPELEVVFRTDDNGTLAALVAEGLGSAIEPRLVVDPRNRDVVALPFGSRIPARTIVLAWHRDRYRPRAAEAFIELAGELAATTLPSAPAASTSRRRGR